LVEKENVVEVPGWGLVTHVIIPLPGYVLGERPILIQLLVLRSVRKEMN
jgi:hypothetical protein